MFAALAPWRCDGTLRSGRPCLKLLAEVDYERPIWVKIVCGRCGHVNVLVERYREPQERQDDDNRARIAETP